MDNQEDSGRLPDGTGLLPSVEPVPVSPLRAAIPSANAWRTDVPPYGTTPIWQYVFIQGEQYHSGHTWARAGWGTAAIRVQHAEDNYRGYRRSDIERICRDNGIDFALGPVIVGWLPMVPPALIAEEHWPALPLRDDGQWSASAIEARSDATGTGSAEGESAAPKADAQTASEPAS